MPIVCLFLGWTVHNDVAYDNTAFWLHVASDVDGRADRLGRLAPPLAIGLPVAVIGLDRDGRDHGQLGLRCPACSA